MDQVFRYFIALILIIIAPSITLGQQRIDKPKDALLFHLDYGYGLPGGDLAKRFGNNFTVGGGLEFKFAKNYFIGMDYSYLWGKTVKEKIARNLYNAKNEIVGIDNHLASIILRERGYALSASLGKLFKIFPDDNSALKVSLGGGWLQHKVRIVDDYGVVTQILDQYLHGYDRLTNGFMTRQYIGYQYLSSNRRINLAVGLVFIQGYTKSVRGYNYDTGLFDTTKRIDLFNGIRIGWILPFYFNDYSEDIIY